MAASTWPMLTLPRNLWLHLDSRPDAKVRAERAADGGELGRRVRAALPRPHEAVDHVARDVQFGIDASFQQSPHVVAPVVGEGIELGDPTCTWAGGSPERSAASESGVA